MVIFGKSLFVRPWRLFNEQLAYVVCPSCKFCNALLLALENVLCFR